jgi:hypothetical protein
MTLVSFILLLVTFMFEKNFYGLFTYPLYSVILSTFSIMLGLFVWTIKYFFFKNTKYDKILNLISIFFYFIGIILFIIAIGFLFYSVI